MANDMTLDDKMPDDKGAHLSTLLLYCRAGFEAECAEEIQAKAAACGIYGYAQAHKNQAFVCFNIHQVVDLSGDASGYLDGDELNEHHQANGALAVFQRMALTDLIFARQWVAAMPLQDNLPARDRVTPLLEQTQLLGQQINSAFSFVHLEVADTNEAKPLLTFCRKFTSPFTQALKHNTLLQASSHLPTLHVFFLDSARAYLGVSPSDNHSPHFMGILRLKFPPKAPSRSTLKLDEAFKQFLTSAQRQRYLQEGMSAVDLGAAPGGWSYQFVRRNIRVFAVDNGPMNDELMATGLVTHAREDGFRYQPPHPVDWLVCDMVERPKKVAELMAVWVKQRRARFALFNLKLPMKKRYAHIEECFDGIRQVMDDARYSLAAKQLYHDREEITVLLHLDEQ